MIIEHRTYTLCPQKRQKWIDLYGTHGLPIQQHHLGKLIGFFVSEIGPLNQVVHLWSYEDLNDRMARRSRMKADPRWVDFLRMNDELDAVRAQENKILVPTDFSPIK
jgi:hypothetical protein